MDLEKLADDYIRPECSCKAGYGRNAKPHKEGCRQLEWLSMATKERLLALLRSVADQARREGLEAAAMVLCHICRLLTDEVVGGKFGPAIERGPKGNWDHPCLTSSEEFYATCMASPVRALATKDKEPASAPTAQNPWSGGHE